MQTFKYSGKTLKRELTFSVIANGRLMAAFRHVNDAKAFAAIQQAEHPTFTYEVEIIL